MTTTKIDWADVVWNPVTGCTPASAGCQNCYAQRMAKRLAGRCGYPADEPFKVTLHPERLEEPLRWRKPRRIFVCSMGDLFHPDVPDEFIGQVFETMACARQHTFLLLTKRPGRMHRFITAYSAPGGPLGNYLHNFPHIWLGVTAENQAMADERIPILLATPAAVRFVSVEPMLGPMDFEHPDNEGYGVEVIKGLDWVILGGETGPGARPMHPQWARHVRDQCVADGVPLFFKQWGEGGRLGTALPGNERKEAGYDYRQKNGGHLLDGQEWRQWPGEAK